MKSNFTANEKEVGLGLILCKEFIEMYGGRIWVESEVGEGRGFVFTLPK
jgi:signal transduction histidine kinase